MHSRALNSPSNIHGTPSTKSSPWHLLFFFPSGHLASTTFKFAVIAATHVKEAHGFRGLRQSGFRSVLVLRGFRLLGRSCRSIRQSPVARVADCRGRLRTRRSTAFVNSRRVQGSRSRLFTYCWCSAVLCLSVRLVVGGSSRSLASLLTGFYVSCALPFVFYLSVFLVRFWSIFLFFVGLGFFGRSQASCAWVPSSIHHLPCAIFIFIISARLSNLFISAFLSLPCSPLFPVRLPFSIYSSGCICTAAPAFADTHAIACHPPHRVVKRASPAAAVSLAPIDPALSIASRLPSRNAPPSPLSALSPLPTPILTDPAKNVAFLCLVSCLIPPSFLLPSC